MISLKKTASGFGVAVASLALFVSVAGAASGPWVANPGTMVEDGVVTLDSTGQPAGTSYENLTLDVPVENGDEITFEYRGDCGGGAPRVFIQGGDYNTWDADPTQCPGTPVGDDWYELSGTVAGIVDGTAGHTGIVNDNTSDPGIIEVRNVVIAGVAVLDEDTSTPAPGEKGACKKGGWTELAHESGSDFKNQGQCIKHANTGK